MRFTFDPRYNIAYLRFQKKRKGVETIKISEELNIDLAPDGTIYGIELLNESIGKVELLYGKSIIRIGAQLYLKRFYESFGFAKSSDIYLEDDIEHIQMTRQITQ